MLDKKQKYRILIIEDDPADAKIIESSLEDHAVRCSIEWATDGETALEKIFREDGTVNCPDLILLDLNLPKRGGQEVLKGIKSDPRTRSIPVLVLSGSSADRDIRAAYEGYANCYIQKPEDLNGFTAITRAVETFWLRTVQLPKRDPHAL